MKHNHRSNLTVILGYEDKKCNNYFNVFTLFNNIHPFIRLFSEINLALSIIK